MYKLSNLAVEDFSAIYEYTLLNFGVLQADADTAHLESTFDLLSNSPLMGYDCPDVASGLRRIDHNRHVIFYRRYEHHILIIRILHQQMEQMKHLFESL